MKDHQSQSQQKFNTSGALVSRQDNDSNITRVTQSASSTSFPNVDVVTPGGPSAARTLKVATDPYDKTTMTQNVGTESRQVSFTRVYGNMTAFVDTMGRTTSFGYDSAGRITSINAPGSIGTTITYDTAGKVTSVTQLENAAGGPGSSVTRLAYLDTNTTAGYDEVQVADPSTDQTQSVTAVPHTTYSDLTGRKLVGKVKDAEGRTRSKTYNPVNQATATGSVDPGGTAESKTTNTYGANGGESLTKSTTNGGLEMTMSYANTSGPSQYQPTGGKDSGNVSQTYAYSGTGNPLSTTGQGGTETSSLEYNTDGTVKSANSPKDATNKTLYGYNTDKQLTSITPKTGSTLGVQNLTYDVYGRTRTATDGRGITATYAYDKLDRLTGTTFSDGMAVNYGYDGGGRNSTRTDPNGTTSYGYDQLGRLTTRRNTFGSGETFTYKYNKAGWLVSSASVVGGTVGYAYDKAGTPTSVSYISGSATRQLIFANDSHGRRTEAWLGSNPDHTTWVAHYKYSYDKNDQVTRLVGEQGSGTASNTDVIDITYCYKQKYNATTAPNGISVGGDCTKDDSATVPAFTKLQWKKDNLSGTTTEYSYKQNGKINQVRISGNSAAIDYDYAYDGNGNRKEGDHATSDTNTDLTDLTFNPENQITTAGFAYDGTGNLTAKPGLTNISYTSAEQLKSVTKNGTVYTYKHAGADNRELLQQTTPEDTYTYAYGRPAQTGIPIVETVTVGAGTASVISDPVTGQPLMLRTASGTQSMYIYDGVLGSPLALITSAAYEAFAYEYDPYGIPTLTANSGGTGVPQNPFLFAGGIQDRTTNWVHYGNRYYDPQTGTWTQRDTLDAPLSPLNANRYAYAGGDPINQTDLSGMFSGPAFAGGLGTLFGGVAILTALYAGAPYAVAAAGLALGTFGLGVAVIGIGIYLTAYGAQY